MGGTPSKDGAAIGPYKDEDKLMRLLETQTSAITSVLLEITRKNEKERARRAEEKQEKADNEVKDTIIKTILLGSVVSCGGYFLSQAAKECRRIVYLHAFAVEPLEAEQTRIATKMLGFASSKVLTDVMIASQKATAGRKAKLLCTVGAGLVSFGMWVGYDEAFRIYDVFNKNKPFNK